MKTFKWMAAVVVGIALTGPLAVAQTAPLNRGGSPGPHMAQRLNLDNAQRQQWRAVQRSFHAENGAFLQSVRETRQQFRAAREAGDTAKMDQLRPALRSQRAQLKQLRAAQDAKLMAILTPEQRTQFESVRAERRNRQQQ